MKYPFRKETIRPTKDDLKRARIPVKYYSAALSKIPDTLSFKPFLLDYLSRLPVCARTSECLVLRGAWGSGKTSIAVCMLKRLIAHAGTGLFLTASEILGAVIDNWSFDEESSMKERALYVDMLIVDDLGKEANAQGANQCVENLVRNRMSQDLSTIITTNLTSKELYFRYPSMFAGVTGQLNFLEIEGIDWRANQQREFEKNRGDRIEEKEIE